MKQNIGTLDRELRVAIGIVLLAAIAFVDSPTRWLGLLGIVPLLTGVSGNCPLYALIGISTCPTSKTKM